LHIINSPRGGQSFRSPSAPPRRAGTCPHRLGRPRSRAPLFLVRALVGAAFRGGPTGGPSLRIWFTQGWVLGSSFSLARGVPIASENELLPHHLGFDFERVSLLRLQLSGDSKLAASHPGRR